MTKLNLGFLKKARRDRKLSTTRAGILLGKDRTCLWRYESGITDIPSRMLCKMIDLYKIWPQDIFVRTQEETKC